MLEGDTVELGSAIDPDVVLGDAMLDIAGRVNIEDEEVLGSSKVLVATAEVKIGSLEIVPRDCEVLLDSPDVDAKISDVEVASFKLVPGSEFADELLSATVVVGDPTSERVLNVVLPGSIRVEEATTLPTPIDVVD